MGTAIRAAVRALLPAIVCVSARAGVGVLAFGGSARAQPPAGRPALARAPADSGAWLVVRADSAMRDRTDTGVTRALALLGQAVGAYERAGLPARAGYALSRMGSLHRSAGRPDSALVYFRRALSQRRAADDLAGVSATLNNIGLVHAAAGRVDSAMASYARAVRTARAAGDANGQAYALTNLGVAYATLGRADSALVHYRAALAMWRRTGSREGEAGALANMAEIAAGAGQRDSALTYYQRALVVWRALGDRRGEALTINNVGALYQEAGHPDSALAAYQLALPIWRAMAEPRHEASTLHNVGGALHALGRPDSALAYYRRALAVQRALGDREGERGTLAGLAELFSRGRLADRLRAVAYFDSAAAAADGLGANAGSDANAVSAAEEQRDLYAGWALAWLARSAELGDRASAAALAAAERGRARALRAAVRRGQHLPPGRLPEAGADLVAEADTLLAPLRRRRTPLLTYLLTRDTLVTWLAAGDGRVRVHRAAVRADMLQALVARMHAGLEVTAGMADGTTDGTTGGTAEYGTPARGAAARLAQLLVPVSLRPYLPAGGELALVPSGPLAAVPFAALRLDASGPPLGIRYALRYAPSVAGLRETGGGAPDDVRLVGLEPGRAVVVGAPDPPTVLAAQTGSPGAGHRARSSTDLPGAVREARWVAARLGTRPLDGREATESAVRERLAEARLVHFATHGYAFGSESRARDSYVTLRPDPGSDGLLTAAELLDDPGLHLRATLVVLSACRTGLGSLTQTEGVIGLPRAFLARGTRSVLASLWSVSDAATELLMQRFYTHWLGDGDRPSKAESLRRAQDDVRHTPRFAAPRYWAAFQLIGDG